MRKANKQLTPAMITELSECEIFVFGSNLAGQHGGGAACIGTVFYQLDWCDEPVSVNRLTMDFIGWRDTKEDRLKKALMSRYTPNFDKEEWKYEALDILGAEFNWRK